MITTQNCPARPGGHVHRICWPTPAAAATARRAGSREISILTPPRFSTRRTAATRSAHSRTGTRCPRPGWIPGRRPPEVGPSALSSRQRTMNNEGGSRASSVYVGNTKPRIGHRSGDRYPLPISRPRRSVAHPNVNNTIRQMLTNERSSGPGETASNEDDHPLFSCSASGPAAQTISPSAAPSSPASDLLPARCGRRQSPGHTARAGDSPAPGDPTASVRPTPNSRWPPWVVAGAVIRGLRVTIDRDRRDPYSPACRPGCRW